jgi:hypothetical protein
MRKVALLGFIAVSLGGFAAEPSFAFGDGCGERAIECYDKVRTPDVYATRTRPVLVRPGWREVVAMPPVVGNVAVPVVVRPGRWRTVATPPVYGTRLERVLVRPRTKSYEVIPPEIRRVEQTVVVSRGGIAWEHRRGFFGREKLCKVVTPPVTRTVMRDVVVTPAQRVVHVTPAVYQTVPRAVLLRPAAAARVYEPPVPGLIARSVVVRPATAQVINHAPVVGIEREQVLVREGRYTWVPSRPGLIGR